jgi:flagellar biogenesis protein FliO
MKNLIYILMIWVLLTPYLYGQGKDAEHLKNDNKQILPKKAPIVTISDQTEDVKLIKTAPVTEAPVVTISDQTEDVKLNNTTPVTEAPVDQTEGTKESTGPKFGSKTHRKNIKYTVTEKKDTNGLLLKTCLSLAAVIGLILVVFKSLKKFNNKYINSGAENPMRVCNRTVLDTKNYLTLVRIYEEELLLAVSPSGTRLIARYALIDKENGEFEEMVNSDGKKVFSIDEETHVSSINLQSLQDMKK